MLVRPTHEERVLRALRERGAMSRGELVRTTRLSRTTLSEITSSLLQRGAIVVLDTDAAQRCGSGRPAERLALDPASGQFLGVDFGHRRVHVAVADAAHEVIASDAAAYPEGASWDARLGEAFALLDRLHATSGVHYGALQAIGIGVPGPTVRLTHDEQGHGSGSGESPRGAAAVQRAFAQRFDVSVLVDNNTRLAALAEAVAGDDTVGNLVYVRLSHGVGGGLVVGGRLVSGAIGLAGELGHVAVVADGAPCRCGLNGCLETVASVPALLAECERRGGRYRDLTALVEAFHAGDAAVDAVLRDAATALGRVLGAAAMVLNPSQIVIGGDLPRLVPAFVAHVDDVIERYRFPALPTRAGVRASRLHDDDGSLGALAAVLHRSMLLDGYPHSVGSPDAPHPGAAARPDDPTPPRRQHGGVAL